MDQERLIDMNWDSFADYLKDMMKDMLIYDDFSDVTIITEDQKRFKAHKNILAASSPVLKELLKVQHEANQILFMRGTFSAEIKSILDFIYLGSVTVDYEKVHELVDLAKDLRIKQLENIHSVEKVEEIDVTPFLETDFEEGKLIIEEADVDQNKCVEDKNIENYQETFIDVDTKESLISNDDESDISIINEAEKNNGSRQHTDIDASSIISPDGEIKLSIENVEETDKRPVTLALNEIPKQQQKGYFCKECQKNFKSPEGLKIHEKSKHQGIRHPCNLCKFSGITGSALRYHVQVEHEGLKFDCEECSMQFNSKQRLKRHKDITHNGIRFPCNDCNYQALDKFCLTDHIQRVHLQIPYPCNLCDFQAKTKQSLQKHNMTEHGFKPNSCFGVKESRFKISRKGMKKVPKKKKSYLCNDCNQSYTTSGGLKVHIRSEHNRIRHQCPDCDFKGITRGALNIHIQSIHEKIRYACKQCDHQATTKSALTLHTDGMHGDNVYFCVECDYQTRYRNQLGSHLRKKHSYQRVTSDMLNFKKESKDTKDIIERIQKILSQ